MFEKALEKGVRFTRPLVAASRMFDGTISARGGAVVVINKEGWFVSAAHLFEVIPLFKRHSGEMKAYKDAAEAAKRGDAGKKAFKKMRPDPKWITASSIWPGADGEGVMDISVVPEADLLLGRLDPFTPPPGIEYPAFKDPAAMTMPGAELVKLGYAYDEIKTSYEKEADKFNIDFSNLVPFPTEGIYTRSIEFRTPVERKVPIRFIETSSPGVRGLAGGPLLDADGAVWGIHSRNSRMPLDSGPERERGGADSFPVGWAVHNEVIYRFLIDKGIDFRKA